MLMFEVIRGEVGTGIDSDTYDAAMPSVSVEKAFLLVS